MLSDQGSELVECSLGDEPPELIVLGADLADIDAVATLVQISRSRAIPSIIVTPTSSLEVVEKALDDHVMAYLVEPVEVEQFKPTIHLVTRRFAQFTELSQEVEELKDALAERKVVERAKGILMRRADIDEDEAYKRLRRMATDGRMKLVEAARQVIAVESALAQ